MNIIQIMGNLGSDPETRYTPSGQKVTTFRIASNSKKGGKEITLWFRVTVWGDKFDKMFSYLKKGSYVLVIGELHKPEIFTNRDNQPQVGLEITADVMKFLPSRGGERTGVQDGVGVGAASSPSFGEGGFGDSTHSYPTGSLSGRGQANGNSFAHAEEEEEIPF